MPDLSIALPSAELEEAFLRLVDAEGKVPAALEALGPVSGRDVVVLDSGHGLRVRQLEEIGARVAAFEFPLSDADAAELAGWVGRADAVVVPWSEMATPGSRFLAEAGSLLRPGGRLLVIHDYGRDDVWGLLPEVHERQVAWSQRNGPFLGDGFRIRVIHCWWTFESTEQARDLLGAAFGDTGVEVAEKMKRLRLEYSIAVYHRLAPGDAGAVAGGAGAVAGGAGAVAGDAGAVAGDARAAGEAEAAGDADAGGAQAQGSGASGGLLRSAAR
jgi:hypothetical protein